jgi:hypothetical protein
MERWPTQSTLKCIGIYHGGCDEKPVGVLRGKHPKGYEIQIMVCKNHLNEGQSFARVNLPGIKFDIWDNPQWLPRVQAEEESKTPASLPDERKTTVVPKKI